MVLFLCGPLLTLRTLRALFPQRKSRRALWLPLRAGV
jgi:hypothetical protein